MFPQLFGKYVLEREIAAGGMARVYLATLRGAVGFEKRLVVKQIRTELASEAAFVARFVEEAKTAVELSHPNIVPVYELGVEQGVYYIAMELCEGLTLSELLAQTGPLGPAEGAYLGAEICRALDYAHRRANIVHRDVTPRNVLIDEEGAVRLIDFGIAAPVTPSHDTSQREIFGSPGHMPPEQLYGRPLTPATDVFAVGALLIEAWTGHAPFRRASAEESEQALFEVPEPLDHGIPELLPLSALIASSVALDAHERPAAAEHLARPLREFSKSEDSGDIARRLAARVQRARRRLQTSPSWRPAGGELGASRAVSESSSTVTRTFAARDDIEVWTRKLASVPAPAAPSEAAESVGARAPTEGLAAAERLVPAHPGTVERASFWGSGRIPWLIAAVSCAALLALGTRRGPAPASRLVPSGQAQLALPSSPAKIPALSIGSSAPVAPPAPVQRAPVLSVARIPRLGPAHLAQTAAAVAPVLGELKITADPRAQVSISGMGYQRRDPTPLLGLRVPPGTYEVVFSNDTFGAPLSTRVQVVSGGTLRVHADFRRAEPAIVLR